MDFQLIYKHPLLSNKDYEVIAGAHSRVNFQKNDVLLKQGEVSGNYYCLEHGLMRSFALNPEGKEITTGFFGKNEIVIEVASLFLSVPTKENIVALTNCTCWRLTLEDFQKLYHTLEGFREWGRTWMSTVLFLSKQRSLSMITDSAKERYLTLLKSSPEIILHAPLKHIATYLGITDSTLSKIRREVINR